MISLAAGPILPVSHGVGGSGSWIVVVVSIAIIAIGITALLAWGSHRSESKPTQERPADDNRQKAA